MLAHGIHSDRADHSIHAIIRQGLGNRASENVDS